MEEKQNLYKEGDWVHTEDGIGIVTCVFPHYYQYWEKAGDDAYRQETYGDDEALATSLLGKKRKVGDWVKDIIYVKRLLDHDLKPMKRIMCFHTVAYANNTITKKEMAAVNRALKDQKLAEKFNKYRCKYRRKVRRWNILVPVAKAVEVQAALSLLDNNTEESLNMTMKDVAGYFNDEFQVDIYQAQKAKIFENAMILTATSAENSDVYYNQHKEEMVRSIRIIRKQYDDDYLSKLIESQGLDRDQYDKAIWDQSGWQEES